MLKPLAVISGRAWKPMYCVLELPVSAAGTSGYLFMSAQTLPPSWQLEQLVLVMLAWIWPVEGIGVRKAVEPSVSVGALPGTRPLGATWQVSQAVTDGMWAFAPIGETGGITTSWMIPAKPPAVDPWQLTQVVRPAWLIAEPLNLAPSSTGSVLMLELAPT